MSDLAQQRLGGRLQNLVEAGVLRIEPASDGSSYREHVPTDEGQGLFDLVIGLRREDRRTHTYESGERYARLVHRTTDQPMPRLAYTTPDGSPVRADEHEYAKPSSGWIARSMSPCFCARSPILRCCRPSYDSTSPRPYGAWLACGPHTCTPQDRRESDDVVDHAHTVLAAG